MISIQIKRHGLFATGLAMTVVASAFGSLAGAQDSKPSLRLASRTTMASRPDPATRVAIGGYWACAESDKSDGEIFTLANLGDGEFAYPRTTWIAWWNCAIQRSRQFHRTTLLASEAIFVEAPQIVWPDLRKTRAIALKLREPKITLPPAVRLGLIPAPAPISVEAPEIAWPDLRESRTFTVKLREPKVNLPPIFPRQDS